MARRVSCIVLTVLMVALMVMPCFAGSTVHTNSIGSNEVPLTFVGINFYEDSVSSVTPYFICDESGVIDKNLGVSSYVKFDTYPYLYLIFQVPKVFYSNISYSFDISIATSQAPTISDIKLYKGVGDISSGISLSYPASTDWSYKYVPKSQLTSISFSSNVKSYNRPDYFVICINITDCNLLCGLTFSQSVGASSGKINMSNIKSSGTVDLGNVKSAYAGTGAIAANALFTVAKTTSGIEYLYPTQTYTWKNAFSNITSSSSLSGSATLSLDASSNSIGLSSYTTTMVRAEGSIVYGDDGGLVDEVFDIGDNVESIAGNMQTLIDDYQAKKDTAEDIGGATSEDTISNTQETLGSGSSSLNSGLSVAGDVSSVSSPAGMYVGLMTATVAPLLNFGNGVLYWALFAILIGSVILFIMRRLN